MSPALGGKPRCGFRTRCAEEGQREAGVLGKSGPGISIPQADEICLFIVRNWRTIVRIMRAKKNNPIDWLFPEARKKTLALLLGDPDRRWYLRDIERRTGLAIGTVRRELTGLAKAEIISKTKDQRRKPNLLSSQLRTSVLVRAFRASKENCGGG